MLKKKKKTLKVGQSKTTFRLIRGMRRKARVTRVGKKKYRVKLLSARLTKARKKKSAWYGHRDKAHRKHTKRDRRTIHLRESWERRQAGIKKVRRK